MGVTMDVVVQSIIVVIVVFSLGLWILFLVSETFDWFWWRLNRETNHNINVTWYNIAEFRAVSRTYGSANFQMGLCRRARCSIVDV